MLIDLVNCIIGNEKKTMFKFDSFELFPAILIGVNDKTNGLRFDVGHDDASKSNLSFFYLIRDQRCIRRSDDFSHDFRNRICLLNSHT